MIRQTKLSQTSQTFRFFRLVLRLLNGYARTTPERSFLITA